MKNGNSPKKAKSSDLLPATIKARDAWKDILPAISTNNCQLGVISNTTIIKFDFKMWGDISRQALIEAIQHHWACTADDTYKNAIYVQKKKV